MSVIQLPEDCITTVTNKVKDSYNHILNTFQSPSVISAVVST